MSDYVLKLNGIRKLSPTSSGFPFNPMKAYEILLKSSNEAVYKEFYFFSFENHPIYYYLNQPFLHNHNNIPEPTPSITPNTPK